MGDQPDRAAGLDGTQLLVIADQPHIGAAAQGVADDLVQGVGARHGGLVDDQDVAGTKVELTLGETELQGGGDLVQSVRGGVDGLAEFLGGARGGPEGVDPAASRAPRLGEGLHGGGLARPGRGQGELHAASGAGELGDHAPLSGIKGYPVQGSVDGVGP